MCLNMAACLPEEGRRTGPLPHFLLQLLLLARQLRGPTDTWIGTTRPRARPDNGAAALPAGRRQHFPQLQLDAARIPKTAADAVPF